MSIPPHREKDAKVEGRDPPEKAKGTMAPFKSLMGRLLRVSMTEVEEQQKTYDKEQQAREVAGLPRLKRKKLSTDDTNKVILPSTNKPEMPCQ
jgi:hypothetical protein